MSLKSLALTVTAKKHLLVNKLIFSKVTVCCSAQSASSLCLWHPVPVMWREIQGELRLSGCCSGRWETWLAIADRRRLLHISILLRRCWCLIAVVWTAALQLSQDRCCYLFLHANKTGASYPPGRCWQHANCLQHFNTSTPQCQLTSAPLELLFLLWSFRCPSHNTSTAGKHCWCVTWLSGVRTHSV